MYGIQELFYDRAQDARDLDEHDEHGKVAK